MVSQERDQVGYRGTSLESQHSELRQENCPEFEASLNYLLNLRPVSAIPQDSFSKRGKKQGVGGDDKIVWPIAKINKATIIMSTIACL